MHDQVNYVPILLTRRGERSALSELDSESKSRITPLFTVHPRDWDYDQECWKKTVSEHVETLVDQLYSCWPDRRAFIDLEHLDEWLDGSIEDHPLTLLIEKSLQLGSNLVPVVAPDRNPDYLNASRHACREYGTGLCLRLKPSLWPSMPEGRSSLSDIMDLMGSTPDEVDLILDLGADTNSELATSAALGEFLALPNSDKWRSITLAGGAFPKDLTGVEKDKIYRVSRSDWGLYRRVAEQLSLQGKRRPDFADYCVAHPDPSLGVNPRFLIISGQIRYTVEDDWLVAKGGQFKRVGGDAVTSPVRLIVQSDEFRGEQYSAGDAWIAQVYQGGDKKGNPEVWRRVATNHHLKFVTDQLANQSET
ncbi:beta family protein [Saccharopolyspora sp. NFXS83]|uniref:beta family protein n=1 Tax=Saccharopolyspora sp. NFXS83 TaxID=2993560 RepID=UPI00224AA8AA|nr:beta family protein [Saccharopolyspora sp. NFXS83]MCX2728952.1 beta family protein [Saccharopolyspora sp. NFXS83]